MTWQHILLAGIWLCIGLAFWFGGLDAAIFCAAASFLGAWKEANSRLDP